MRRFARCRLQVGKAPLYRLLKEQGRMVHQYPGIVTQQLRDPYALTNSHQKDAQTCTSHAVAAWVLAAATSGATTPTCTRLWYVVPAILHRRQLTRQEASTGRVFTPYGGTLSLGFKRGTLVRHPPYALCTVGGSDRQKRQISLPAYRTNTRLTQQAKPEECRRLTTVAFRSWLISNQKGRST